MKESTKEPPYIDFPWWDDRNTRTPKEPIKKNAIEINRIFSSPKSIFDYFDSKIYGNEQYKKSLATAIWSALKKDIKSNFLIIGKSGCG